MTERVDLDAFAACVQGDQPFMVEETLAVVTELRAAREVVEEARAWAAPENEALMPYAAARDFRELLAAYDQATGAVP